MIVIDIHIVGSSNPLYRKTFNANRSFHFEIRRNEIALFVGNVGGRFAGLGAI